MLCIRSALLMIALATGTSGCIQPVVPGVPGLEPEPPRTIPGQRPSPGADDRSRLSRKRVARKEPVSTLIAKDGSWCTVSEDRFRMIEVDDNVWCAWTG
jgi:hypothetical protein